MREPLKYYVKPAGGFPHQVDYDTFRRIARRKGNHEVVMINGGYKVGRVAVDNH